MKIKTLISRIALVGLLVGLVVPWQPALAAELTGRKVTLSSSAIGSVVPAGSAAAHTFDFTIPSSNSVGSIEFLYCTTALGACTTPTGLVTTGATLTAQSGETGFSIDTDDVNGSPYITRTAAAVTPGAVQYTLSNITNPTTQNTSFFIRITTYASTDTSGGSIDAGTVVASTAQQITVSGTMPESLVFCVGTTWTSSCGDISGTSIDLGTFSPGATSSGTSVMAASTNAGSGYAITVNGSTLTSGVNTITALAAQTTSQVGVSQFGINLRANTTPAVGANPSGTGSGSYTANYGTADQYRFVSGNIVASAAGPTNQNLFTTSYIVNVPGSQAAGLYTATMTYICTATF